jgi:creatinine amidohydrolase
VDLLTTATSPQIRDRNPKTAVLPIGSFEQHSTFLPLITDTVVACGIGIEVEKRYDVLLLPPVTISCSHEHSAFAGTVSVSARTLHAYVNDIAESLSRSGIPRLVLVNGHGGNYVLSNIVQEANVVDRRMSLFPGRSDWERARADAGLATTVHDDMHAGELEVSLLLHMAPHLVGEQYSEADSPADDRPHLLVLGVDGYSTSGVIGRPSLGSPSKPGLRLRGSPGSAGPGVRSVRARSGSSDSALARDLRAGAPTPRQHRPVRDRCGRSRPSAAVRRQDRPSRGL